MLLASPILFIFRYNVTRHEKICKLNSSISTVAENIGTDAKHFFCMLCQKMFGTEDALNNHQKKCKVCLSDAQICNQYAKLWFYVITKFYFQLLVYLMYCVSHLLKLCSAIVHYRRVYDS